MKKQLSKQMTKTVSLILFGMMILSMLSYSTISYAEQSEEKQATAQENITEAVEETSEEEIASSLQSPKRATSIPIDKEHFPDPIFRNYVKEEFDTKVPKDILTEWEIDAVTKIDCSGKEIESLAGVEYFTVLQKLNCNNNKLTGLDLNNNKRLESLDCSINQLKSLDVSQNKQLKYLFCYNNQLRELDVSQNKQLEDLFCYNNQLTTLDVSQSKELRRLYCDNNQLTGLNVSNNTRLYALSCSNNDLTTLDVGKHSDLYHFVCYGNKKIQTLDVSKVPGLKNIVKLENYKRHPGGYVSYSTSDVDGLFFDKGLKIIIGGEVVPTVCIVTFDSNGGAGTMADEKINQGEQLTLPECGFSAPENKEFDKWDKGNPGEKSP